jgi:phospholipid transport system substrate-binding protein
MMKKTVISLLLLGLSLLSSGATTRAADDGASAAASIEKLHGVFVSVLKEADVLGYKGRFDRLAPIIRGTFDLAFMAQAVLGRQWKQLKEQEQASWVEHFARLTIANYAGRLNRYTGQTFETLSHEPAASETVLVRTRVIDPSDENVDLDYRLRQINGDWRVIDIYAKGAISELALRRSEYASVLKQEGYEALLKGVEDKIDALAAGKVSNGP